MQFKAPYPQERGADRFSFLIIIFDQNKDHTINDQCNRNNHIVIEFLFNDIIKRKCYHNSRDTCNQNFKPQDPLVFVTELLYKSQHNTGNRIFAGSCAFFFFGICLM